VHWINLTLDVNIWKWRVVVNTLTIFLVPLNGGTSLEQPDGPFLKKESGYFAVQVQET
jgi:hypothetical protein